MYKVGVLKSLTVTLSCIINVNNIDMMAYSPSGVFTVILTLEII